MSRFIITPWRNQAELIAVRQEFYAPANGSEDLRRQACNMVAAWKIRGRVPHAILSTAYLTDAVLGDTDEKSVFSRQGVYASAVSRFVSGLTDIEQNRRLRRSMFEVARAIGLPTSFIELRHRIAHEEMPNLLTLRRAAQNALKWLHDDYWLHVGSYKKDRRKQMVDDDQAVEEDKEDEDKEDEDEEDEDEENEEGEAAVKAFSDQN